MELTERQREILEHTLTGGTGKVYRNYFATDLDKDDGITCVELEKLGYMSRFENAISKEAGFVYFRVTENGAKSVGLLLP